MNTYRRHYVVISPVRDEDQFIEKMIESVIRQTVRPTQWILVDDGSSDQTPIILERFARQLPWVRIVRRADRGSRKSGSGVVKAFYDGYRALDCQGWDFIVKLDGDLILGHQYFELCLKRFDEDSRLGIGGGMISSIRDGKEELEECPRFHVRGATKIYRRRCWEDIGGLWPAAGWDTIDELKALMLGWQTESFQEIRILQQRPTGKSVSLWTDLLKNGQARYIAGYHPIFLLASCIRRSMRRPFLIGSIGLFCGFLLGYLKRTPRIDDPELVRFIRREQLKRLTGRRTVWN